jgi:hypothetical protein
MSGGDRHRLQLDLLYEWIVERRKQMSRKSRKAKKTWREKAIASATAGIFAALSMIAASLSISTSDVAQAAGKSNASSPGNGMNKAAPTTAKPKSDTGPTPPDKPNTGDRAFKKL